MIAERFHGQRRMIERNGRDRQGFIAEGPRRRPRALVIAHHAQHSVGVVGIAREGAEFAGHFGGSRIGDAGQDRGGTRRRWRGLARCHRRCRTTSRGRRYWRSQDPACDICRNSRRSLLREIAPSLPRFRAPWSTVGPHVRKPRLSRSPRSGIAELHRFSEARLHAVSSRNIYSEQGFRRDDRACGRAVCQSLIVV